MSTRSLFALLAVGFLVSAFVNLEVWRTHLIGQSAMDLTAALGLLLVVTAAGWRSLLRRDFAYAEPAALTFTDFAGRDRSHAISVRLLGTWLLRLLALAYLTALVCAVYAAPAVVWSAGGAVLAGSALLALAAARRPTGWAHWPIALAALGIVALPAGWLAWVGVGLAVIGAGRWPGSGPLTRPRVASAGRLRLVATWNERLVRTVAVSFLDPTLMLPTARPTRMRSLGPPVLPRLALLGVRGRLRFAEPAALLAVLVALAKDALPAIPPVLLVAIGGYLALVPFGGGLGELWRHRGRRRWIGASDGAVRVWHTAILTGVAALWAGLVAVATLLLSTPPPPTTWLVLPFVVAAIHRTVTRPLIDYADLGITDTPFGLMPLGLVFQSLRGPDLLVVTLLLWSAF